MAVGLLMIAFAWKVDSKRTDKKIGTMIIHLNGIKRYFAASNL